MTGMMMRAGLFAGSLGLLVALAAPALAETPEAFLAAVDTNNDKTLSLPEVQAYALKRFDALDKNREGTLSEEELGDRMAAADFDLADTKRKSPERTLSKVEFSIYVSKLFAAADTSIKSGETPVDGKLSLKARDTRWREADQAPGVDTPLLPG